MRARLLLALALAVAAGCQDTAFIDEQAGQPPLGSANGFLGYFDAATGLTTCGNCHVGKQAAWATTAHARAWADLQASGSAAPACYGCHSVNQRGNLETDPGGFALREDPIFHDVQCEACHGPGLEHVADPDAFRPLASIRADTAATVGCGECHSGIHNPFVEQWASSRHATIPSGSRATSPSCVACHNGEAALEAQFGETDIYLEHDDGAPSAITCAVCHDPHGSPNDHQLRAPIDVATQEHLCVRCHSRRATPPSAGGPHAPQGLLVLGQNVGWIPPGFVYDTIRIVSTHGSEANPKLCATCHVPQFAVTSPATGDFVFRSVGHRFEAAVCLGADSLPVDGPCAVDQRDFRACAASGCHGSAIQARTAFTTVRQRLNGYLDQLWDDTDGDGVMEASDGGLLPQVVAQNDTFALNLRDQTVTVAEGALWNAQLAFTTDRPRWGDGRVFGGTFRAHRGSGGGVHNPFLLEALLTASIDAVIAAYGVTPTTEYDGRMRALVPPGVRTR